MTHDTSVEAALARYRKLVDDGEMSRADLAELIMIFQRQMVRGEGRMMSTTILQWAQFRAVLALVVFLAHDGRYCDGTVVWCSNGSRVWTERPTDQDRILHAAEANKCKN